MPPPAPTALSGCSVRGCASQAWNSRTKGSNQPGPAQMGKLRQARWGHALSLHPAGSQLRPVLDSIIHTRF